MREHPAERADGLLAEAGAVLAELDAARGALDAALERVRAEHGPAVERLETRLADLDRAIKALARRERGTLFDGRDRCDLPHGALLIQIEERVVRARGVLEALKEMGASEAVKVVETVNWDVLETWPDERLIQAGTERKRRETFAWEAKREQAA